MHSGSGRWWACREDRQQGDRVPRGSGSSSAPDHTTLTAPKGRGYQEVQCSRPHRISCTKGTGYREVQEAVVLQTTLTQLELAGFRLDPALAGFGLDSALAGFRLVQHWPKFPLRNRSHTGHLHEHIHKLEPHPQWTITTSTLGGNQLVVPVLPSSYVWRALLTPAIATAVC